MKVSVAITVTAAIVAKVSATCFSEILGYPCCTSSVAPVLYTDNDGNWSVEKGNWCGIPENQIDDDDCWAHKLGYSCCSHTERVVYTDDDGEWGIEDNQWCGLNNSNFINPIDIKSDNPFSGRDYYINPEYIAKVDKAISEMSDPLLIVKAEKIKNYSNAIWLNSIDEMNEKLEINLKNAYYEQLQSGKEVLSVFVLNNLPGRNCHALSTHGELLPNDDDLARYKNEYIDVIEEKLKAYKNQPVALIVEPDSLINLITKIDTTPACAEAEKYYLDGHAYLIKRLGTLPNVAIYLDIGNSSLLGWEEYHEKMAKLYHDVIQSGAPGTVRGFASNVANYTPWEDPEAYPGPNYRGPDMEWNPNPDESSYIKTMYKTFVSGGIKSVRFIVDTSRNGKRTNREQDDEWCNVTGYGIGARPQANPISEMSYVDAFYWVKPVGESDGTTDEKSKYFEDYCKHRTSMKPSPEEGEWFQAHFEQGIENANPPLTE
ncbi:glycoside hydrolase family 6 protein [Piromyces sp. E2]|nr:glycoside hydrolase family 6 protein [Piromyces sp. E2]|eukprot:OUM61929.1 glycoside hydrolase family 6 protein [Piromyces sp. E2]